MPAFRGFGARDQTGAGHLWDLRAGQARTSRECQKVAELSGLPLKGKGKGKSPVSPKHIVRAPRKREMSVSANDVEDCGPVFSGRGPRSCPGPSFSVSSGLVRAAVPCSLLPPSVPSYLYTASAVSIATPAVCMVSVKPHFGITFRLLPYLASYML